ncbi:2Fe-2S iron-sulfur cluster binding domain-containing protein [Hoyosella rhizosphaerae]|uniref:Ferredoxin n=1 Tax=Hoyosella rhizosphaerae TaxID=1755582 RepID=A0A916XBK6_9ACTN|nr:2Fe-2S iron-sulfur cluster-binding protein [Hoyosella rhizosphaerae]MBN4927751.1 2Fe-2S iron-sulfur cluster binding domain-containing protein [Hoyosella rhizosphaerae]GGC61833.1 putative ferredoxin [Hoyosella rhizosphaerae]
MGTITFISHDGEETEVEIVEGQSLMQLATNNGLAGIDGDCGGEAACGTCHIILEAEWFSKTGDQSDDEAQMLDLTPERVATSRLSCQIKATEAMDGMIVHLPEFQM